MSETPEVKPVGLPLVYSPITIRLDTGDDPPEKREQIRQRVDVAIKAWYEANERYVKSLQEGLEMCVRAAITMKVPGEPERKKIKVVKR